MPEISAHGNPFNEFDALDRSARDSTKTDLLRAQRNILIEMGAIETSNGGFSNITVDVKDAYWDLRRRLNEVNRRLALLS